MIAASFDPRLVTRIDGAGRQIDFKLSEDGIASVEVRYGLKKINTVFPQKVYVQSSTTGLNMPKMKSLELMTPSQRSDIIDAIARNAVDMKLENGPASGVSMRNTTGTAYFHQIESITLVMQ